MPISSPGDVILAEPFPESPSSLPKPLSVHVNSPSPFLLPPCLHVHHVPSLEEFVEFLTLVIRNIGNVNGDVMSVSSLELEK